MHSLNTYFGSVFQPRDAPSDIYSLGSVNAITINNISVEDVIKQINKLDAKKGVAPDGLSTIFIKSCSNSISYPLSIICNKSLFATYVVPVHKGGNKNMCVTISFRQNI